LPCMTLERMMDNGCAELLCNLQGCIGTAGIYNQHLTAQACKTVEAASKVPFFVFRENHEADGHDTRVRVALLRGIHLSNQPKLTSSEFVRRIDLILPS
jgi:hypothetical protein